MKKEYREFGSPLKQKDGRSFFEKYFRGYGWEWMLVVIFVFVNIMNSVISPYYLNFNSLMNSTTTFLDKGLLALSMSLVLVIGYIDISVASTVALSSVVMGVVYNAGEGVSMPVAMIICLLVGAICGMINGLLLTVFHELAPMIVTLSTQIIYRGIATLILEDTAAGGFPQWFGKISHGSLGPIPYILIVFAIFAVGYAILLQKTKFGRQLYAMGANMTASKFSGIKTNRNIFIVYTLNGLMAAITAIFLTARMSSTRPNIALAYEMDVIAMVVLGGISTAGGKGRMPGVLISIFIIGLLRYGLGLININAQILLIVVGALLIFAVALPEVKGVFARRKEERRKVAQN